MRAGQAGNATGFQPDVDEFDSRYPLQKTGVNINKELIPLFVSIAAFRTIGYVIEISEINNENKITKILDKKGQQVSESQFAKTLWAAGMDTKNHKFKIENPVPHRIGGRPKVHVDYRVAGVERTDQKWIESGYASLEAYMTSSKMQDMVSHSHSHIINEKEFDRIEN